MSAPNTFVTLLDYVPSGQVIEDHLAVLTGPRPRLAAGEVLVGQLAISVDPLMRGRMNGLDSVFLPQFEPGRPLVSDAVGRVIESRNPGFFPGELVHGWMDGSQLAAAKRRPSTSRGTPELTNAGPYSP